MRNSVNCCVSSLNLPSSLAKACRTYHLEIEEPGREKFIPICVTDTFLGTYMWLQSPQAIDKLAKRKIIAEVYAVLQPTDSMIRKYLTEVEYYYNKQDISEEDYLLLRASSVINELLPESADTVEQITNKTPLEILEKIKNQSKEEGLRKYYEEREEHKKTRLELEREREDRETRKTKKKAQLRNIISHIFDWLVTIGIFVAIFGATYLFNITNATIKIIAAIILGFIGSGSFWGFGRGQDFYEQWKSKIILPIIDNIFGKFWSDL